MHPNGKDCFIDGIIDSGAEASLIPYDSFAKWINGRLDQSNAELYNFDGLHISGLQGEFMATIEYNDRKAKLPLLVLDTIKIATWGVDAIEALRLVIDSSTRLINSIQHGDRTITAASNEPVSTTVTDEHSEKVVQVQAIKPVPKMVDELPQLIADGIGKFPDFEHQITLSTDAVPVARAARPVPIARRAAVEIEIEQMVKDDIWEQVNGPSPWALNLVTVPKSDGKIRITTDFSPLNKFVIPNRHPLPRILDLYLQLQGATIFSKLDLAKGYWHIQLAPESRSLTTTITPYGLYQYKRLPMGLTDAASVFQRLVSQTLLGCEGCISYLNDILVFGSMASQHDERLRIVLQKLADKDFRFNIAKCCFSVDNVLFLGHQISISGIKPDPSSLDAIRNAPIPKSITDVRSFLGWINYLREFLPRLADHAEPLQQLTRTSEQAKFEWNDKCTAAFEKLKSLLTSNLQLAIFDPDRPTMLATDASNIGLGACLSQIARGRLIPIAFASKTLTNQERAYATNKREALGCVWACEHFANFLLGRHFTLITDHQALVTILAQADDGRKAHKFDRWRMRLSEFDYEIQHHPGSDNIVPDMLSRLPQPDASTKVRIVQLENFLLDNIAKATAKDKLLQTVIKLVESNNWMPTNRKNADLAPYFVVRNDLVVEQSILWKAGRVVVPTSLRKSLLIKSHNGHPGIVRAKAKLRETYWWPRITANIEETIRHCQGCQDSAKSGPKANIPTDPLPLPTAPWEKVAINVTGPFATTNYQNRFAIVVVDYLSGYPEVRLCSDHNVTTTIEFLTELFARYDNPSILVSDNGPEYLSTAFEEFLSGRDILHHRAPVYHPQANGKVEVFNRSLKFHAQTLAASQMPFPVSIIELLARYRAERPTPDTLSPAEIMFNWCPRLSFEPRAMAEHDAVILKKPLKKTRKGRHVQFKEEEAPEPTSPMNQRRAPLFKVGDEVRVKKPSTSIRKGESPYSSKSSKFWATTFSSYLMVTLGMLAGCDDIFRQPQPTCGSTMTSPRSPIDASRPVLHEAKDHVDIHPDEGQLRRGQ